MHIVVYGVKKALVNRRASSPYSTVTNPSSLSPPPNAPNLSPQTKRKWFHLRSKTSPRFSRRQSDGPSEQTLDVDRDSWDSGDILDTAERPDALEPFIWVNVQLLDHRYVLLAQCLPSINQCMLLSCSCRLYSSQRFGPRPLSSSLLVLSISLPALHSSPFLTTCTSHS